MGIRLLLLVSTFSSVLLLQACSRSTEGSQTVRGVLVDLETASLTHVDGFTLRDENGQYWVFHTAPDFNRGAGAAMTPGHMREHMSLGQPVTVTYRSDQDGLEALSATD